MALPNLSNGSSGMSKVGMFGFQHLHPFASMRLAVESTLLSLFRVFLLHFRLIANRFILVVSSKYFVLLVLDFGVDEFCFPQPGR